MLSSVPYLYRGLKASSIRIPILLTGKLKLREVKTETPKAQSWEVLELDAKPRLPKVFISCLASPPRCGQPELAWCPVTGMLSAFSSGPWSGPPIVIGLCRKPLLWHSSWLCSLIQVTHTWL